MGKSNVNPGHYKVAGRERQGEDILQTRHKEKYTRSLIPGRSAPHATRERPALIPGPPPRGAAPLRPANAAARTTVKKKAAAKKNAPKKRAAKKASTKTPGAISRGTRSKARKRASSR